MRIKVSIRDKVGKPFRATETIYAEKVSQEGTKKLAEACASYMKYFIMATSDQPSGHLASLITAEPIMGGWGVGDIPTLDKEAPYWNHIDKGSLGINANWEHFLPKGFWSNGRWIVTSSGYAGIKPKTPIPAKNYIAQTLAMMNVITPSILGEK